MSPDPNHYKLLKLIEANPAIQQREMAKVMGVSLGKTNYCLKALMQKGLVKMDNFRRADNKLAYCYALTPSGIEARARLTVSFLKHKVAEFEAIRNEIEQLRREVDREALAESGSLSSVQIEQLHQNHGIADVSGYEAMK